MFLSEKNSLSLQRNENNILKAGFQYRNEHQMSFLENKLFWLVCVRLCGFIL